MAAFIQRERINSGWQVWSLARLLRPYNLAMMIVGVALGAGLAEGMDAFEGRNVSRVWLAALSVALVAGAAYCLNDAVDLTADQVNRPARPLPSGLWSVRSAKWLWQIGTAGGLIAGMLLSAWHGAMALTAALLLYVYNTRLKGAVVFGNLIIAGLIALVFVYGGLAVGAVAPVLPAAVFAFLTTLAREIIKDVEDVVGDERAGKRTLPLAYGPETAVHVATLVIAFTLVLTPLPFLLIGYSGLYLLFVLGTDVVLLRVLWVLQKRPCRQHAGRAGSLMKWAMTIGLLALFFSGSV